MKDNNRRFFIYTIARRLTDQKKFVCMLPVSNEIFDGEQFTDQNVYKSVKVEINEFILKESVTPYKITSVSVTEGEIDDWPRIYRRQIDKSLFS